MQASAIVRVLFNENARKLMVAGLHLRGLWDKPQLQGISRQKGDPWVSILRLSALRNVLTKARLRFFRGVMKMDIHPTVEMSLSAKMDMTFPKGVHIGECTYVAFNARILTHDRTRGLYVHTHVGKNCFLGGESLIMPGVTIGDNCVIGAGSVVTRDVPARSIVAGNPAQIIREGIEVGPYGRFLDADETERQIRDTDPSAADLPSRLAR
ncbi:DapH/DapD/GlmU-related protein [Erythrobacter sp. KY5]|uniref:acyltransferase n=1 Tax=Erythrobacter sp. KY5 TaxID=2011159 RepID=UPI001F38CDDA|nr:DapH/DapD/GlmU-related protein [Erythrobacter sp. KY5]